MKNSKWKSVKRYSKQERRDYLNQILQFSSNMKLSEKVHICNVSLPDIYDILIRNDKEVYAFDTEGMFIYGEDTETPIEVILNYYKQRSAESII
jgi:hypothetical protein